MLCFTSKCNKNKHHLKCNFTLDWEKRKCLTTPHSEKKAEKKKSSHTDRLEDRSHYTGEQLCSRK